MFLDFLAKKKTKKKKKRKKSNILYSLMCVIICSSLSARAASSTLFFSPIPCFFWSRALLPVFGIHPGSSLISKAGMLGNWKVCGWQESSGFGFISPTLFLDANRCQLSSLFFFFVLLYCLLFIYLTLLSHPAVVLHKWRDGEERKNMTVAKSGWLHVLLDWRLVLMFGMPREAGGEQTYVRGSVFIFYIAK